YEHEFESFSYDYTDKKNRRCCFERIDNREDVLISPHIAFYTNIAVKNMVEIALDSALNIIIQGYSENEVILNEV
ncbi:lactate dehydrogenase, partial [Mammaliicoccus vitulinus]